MATGLTSRRFVDPPPFLTFESFDVDHDKLTQFKDCLTEAKNTLRSQGQLMMEFSLLKNLRYSRWATFRKHKQMQAITRVLRCLSNLEEMKMCRLYEDFDSSCPRFKSNKKKSVILPSKQMLEFVLVRTVGLLNLLLQACDYCFLATEYTYDRLKATQFVGYNIIVAACLSRIWIICATLAVKTVEWYEKLYPWINTLMSSQIQWLPSEQVLPISVQHKLKSGSFFLVQQAVKNFEDRPEIYQNIRTKPKKDALKSLKKLLGSILNVAGHDVETESALLEENASEVRMPFATYQSQDEEQLGEIILRRSVEEDPEKPKTFMIENFLNSINTEEQLFAWLNQENVLRKCKAHQLSLRLQAHHWRPFYKLLHRMKHQKDLQHQKNVIIDWFQQPGKNLKRLEKRKTKKQEAKSCLNHLESKETNHEETYTPVGIEETNLVLNPNHEVMDKSVEDSDVLTLSQCKRKSRKRHLILKDSSEPVCKQKKPKKLRSNSDQVVAMKNLPEKYLLQEIDDIFSILDEN